MITPSPDLLGPVGRTRVQAILAGRPLRYSLRDAQQGLRAWRAGGIRDVSIWPVASGAQQKSRRRRRLFSLVSTPRLSAMI